VFVNVGPEPEQLADALGQCRPVASRVTSTRSSVHAVGGEVGAN
jgi:hypothetical protein